MTDWKTLLAILGVIGILGGWVWWLAHVDMTLEDVVVTNRAQDSYHEQVGQAVKQLTDRQVKQDADREFMEKRCKIGQLDRVTCSVWGLEWETPQDE